MAKKPTTAKDAAPAAEGMSTAEMFPDRETFVLLDAPVVDLSLSNDPRAAQAESKSAQIGAPGVKMIRELAFRSKLTNALGAFERIATADADSEDALVEALAETISADCPPGRSAIVGAVRMDRIGAKFVGYVTVRFV